MQQRNPMLLLPWVSRLPLSPHRTIPRAFEILRHRTILTRFSETPKWRVQKIMQLYLPCLQHLSQKRSPTRLTAVYRETRGWLCGCLRVGDVPFPAGNFHRILVPDLDRAANRRKAASGAFGSRSGRVATRGVTCHIGTTPSRVPSEINPTGIADPKGPRRG